MSAKDAHYGGNLVDGAHMVHLFGDVATELLIKCDGDEGLFCASTTTWNSWRLSMLATISRLRAPSPRSAIPPEDDLRGPQGHHLRPDINDSAADVLAEPVVVCRASGTCVVPKDKQRIAR